MGGWGAPSNYVLKFGSIIFQLPLRMRVRIGYTANSAPVLEQSEISNFPAELLI